MSPSMTRAAAFIRSVANEDTMAKVAALAALLDATEAAARADERERCVAEHSEKALLALDRAIARTA